MDIEQLKLILEMVGVAGEGAKDLALLWFALAFLKSLIGPAVGALLIVVAYRVTNTAIHGFTLAGLVADELGTYLPLSTAEKKRCVEVLRVGLKGE